MRSAYQNYSADLPVPSSFKQLLHDIILYLIQNPADCSFAEQYENSPLLTPATQEEIQRLFEPVMDLFNRATAEKLLKEMPAPMLFALIYGSISSLAKLYLSQKVELDEASLDAALDAVWDLIKR
jgi:hypothetical protein